MIKSREEQTKTSEYNASGKKAFDLYDLSEFKGINDRIKQFSYVELDVGEEVPYHVHEGNTENYYIISGNGVYNDNGTEISVSDGVITFTPSGQGHSLRNVGRDKLTFIALVLLN